jgi:hypothetical protein
LFGVNHDPNSSDFGPGGDYSGYSLTFFSEGRRLSLSTRLGHNRLNEILNKADAVINARLKAKENLFTDQELSRPWAADIIADKNLTSAYIRSFFEQVHPLYPFLDTQAFREMISSPQFPQLLQSNKAWSALYHAVLALGSQYNNGGTFEPGQNRAWQLFSVSLALFSDLVVLPDSLIALQAVTAMVRDLQPATDLIFANSLIGYLRVGRLLHTDRVQDDLRMCTKGTELESDPIEGVLG